MRVVIVCLALIAGIVAGAGSARANNDASGSRLVLSVSIAQQRLRVAVDGKLRYIVRVATAGRGYATPTGTFHPTRLAWKHRSSEWHIEVDGRWVGAPMNRAVFFYRGTALHIGNPSRRSHGCIHVSAQYMTEIYRLVEHFGRLHTLIIVHR